MTKRTDPGRGGAGRNGNKFKGPGSSDSAVEERMSYFSFSFFVLFLLCLRKRHEKGRQAIGGAESSGCEHVYLC